MDAVVGIDIGGTNTEIGVVDRNGKIIYRDHTPTLTFCDVNKFLVVLAGKIKEAMINMPSDVNICAIGIGAPNGNYYTGCIDNAPNLGWGEKVAIISLFKTHFPRLVMALANDANAAAVGEMLFGAAKGMKDFIMLTLGTGVGSGIVVNGKLLLGHDGSAGELGHMTVVPGGRECGCGNMGCLETYASATGLVRTVTELLALNRMPSALRDVPMSKLTSKMVYESAVAGDDIAREAFEYTGEVLGTAIADMVTFSNPEAVFLFGGLTKAGKMIMEPTQNALNDNMRQMFSRPVKVIFSKLAGSDVAILGAAAIAWSELNQS